MPENIQRQENTIREKVFELFKNKIFIEYSPLFYESPKTISQVLRLLGKKGRATINNQLKIFRQNGEYDPNYIKTEVSWKPPQKKLLFTHRVVANLVDFYAQERGEKLTVEEVELLLEFMNLPGISRVLRKQAKSWFDVFCNLTLMMVFVRAHHEKIKGREIIVKTLPPSIGSLTVFDGLDEDERTNFLQDIQKFAEKGGTRLYQLAVKIVDLRIPITFTSFDFYTTVASGVMEAAKYGGEAIWKVCCVIDPTLPRKARSRKSRGKAIEKLMELGIDVK